MPKANWMVCAVRNRAAASKTVAAWDAADNASKHGPSVPRRKAQRDKQSALRLDRFIRT